MALVDFELLLANYAAQIATLGLPLPNIRDKIESIEPKSATNAS
jgi:hypothetical protein